MNPFATPPHSGVVHNWLTGECPAGYEEMVGDVSGWGTYLGSKINTTLQGCAERCTQKSNCLSFEHSNTTSFCNLSDVKHPIRRYNYEDYVFCSKIGKS